MVSSLIKPDHQMCSWGSHWADAKGPGSRSFSGLHVPAQCHLPHLGLPTGLLSPIAHLKHTQEAINTVSFVLSTPVFLSCKVEKIHSASSEITHRAL